MSWLSAKLFATCSRGGKAGFHALAEKVALELGQYLRDAGVPIAFASDWPVSDVNPMRGIKAAITRKPWKDGHPGHASTLMEALHGYSAGGAYAGFDEGRFGMLKEGMLADIVIMDRDLESAPVETLDQARAALTLCGGTVTWEG